MSIPVVHPNVGYHRFLEPRSAYDRGMPSDAPGIARKTKLGAASRPAVLEGRGPAGLGGALAQVIGNSVSAGLDGTHD
jgi:hypothetical protein